MVESRAMEWEQQSQTTTSNIHHKILISQTTSIKECHPKITLKTLSINRTIIMGRVILPTHSISHLPECKVHLSKITTDRGSKSMMKRTLLEMNWRSDNFSSKCKRMIDSKIDKIQSLPQERPLMPATNMRSLKCFVSWLQS